MMKRLLIRADDLGYARSVNYGIYDSVHQGIINNVGVMVNMPETQMGLDLLKNENIDFGLHTNISNGAPILSSNEVPSLVGDNGNFRSSKEYRKNYVDGKKDIIALNDVVAEIEAQYKKFIELVGRKPDYFEGHAVMSDNFEKGLRIVVY
ncbi:ChbG/HpnK family deacetylase [Lactobacillus acidophilus]|nr:ChbG/HpnK family deacetylase [Lactobacillus acidophilus]MBN3463462.1 ChbG/HpnK family deacetylase [Lactobacillus acidophilus]MBN3464497.1 ChbG/HpnK family deacetylase [Lactobacillus acidophilus]MBN3466989.1 ChbG/HpnK family deacetylase [Lactobacillus acidophilus]MBN3473998.1 ChbG/HpnK family deacetylase [Lactobacillus acidophilus]